MSFNKYGNKEQDTDSFIAIYKYVWDTTYVQQMVRTRSPYININVQIFVATSTRRLKLDVAEIDVICL